MLCFVDFVQILIDDMSVGGRYLNTCVAEKIANIREVGIFTQKISCKRVAERVRMNILAKPGFLCAILYDHLNHARVNAIGTFQLF